MALTDSLLSYHKLEDLTDSVGSRTLTNTGSTANVSAKIGNGYDSSTSNSTKRLGNTTNYWINWWACSISAWIKINWNHSVVDHPLAVNEYCGSNGSAYILNGIGFNQTNTQVQFSRLRTAVAWQDAVYAFTPWTTFHHYVYTYDGTSIRWYVDWTLVVWPTAASGGGTTEVRDTWLAILGSNYTSWHWFSGIVDEVWVWNRAITASEVTELYNSWNWLAYPFSTFIPKITFL